MKTGVDLIAEERQRQINEEGFDASHDSQYGMDELALAAVAFAAPCRMYTLPQTTEKGFEFLDPFQLTHWDEKWDYRKKLEEAIAGLTGMDRARAKREFRARVLTVAGALIAAEIDRLQR